MTVSRNVTPEGIQVFRVQGKLVAVSLDDLKRELDTVREESNVVLNLKGVHLVDSVAVGYLVQRHGVFKRAGGDIVLCDVHPSVVRLLSMADLDKHFTIYAREDEAIAAAKELPPPPSQPKKRGRKPKPRPPV